MKCTCAQAPTLVYSVKDPGTIFNTSTLKLVKIHPNNTRKFFYKCAVCGQAWEKQTQPHHYGYTETWKKLEAIPAIPQK